ncbi:hypothetical protein JTB14_032127 [Gonioctena quinquepunctata]|nr:hypothetical protein JTB14_032127 [Gonioctena quinquepunctata]
MGQWCMVLQYKNCSKNSSLSFFSLTKKRYRSWMKAIGRDPSIEKLSHGNVICEEHFIIDDFITSGGKKRLKHDAVPRLKLGPRKPLSTLQNLTLGVAEVSLPSIFEQEVSNKENIDFQNSYNIAISATMKKTIFSTRSERMVLMARNLEIQSDSGDTQAVYDEKEKPELTELTNVNYEYDITEGYHINMPETHQFLDTDINKIENVVETKCDGMMPRINVLQDIVIPLEQNIDINTEINDGHTLRESQSVNEVETVTEVPNQSQLLTKKEYPRKRKTNTIKKMRKKKLKLQEKRQAYALKECTSCTNKSIRKCKDKITENRRQQINDEFWKMSWSEQRILLLASVRDKF